MKNFLVLLLLTIWGQLPAMAEEIVRCEYIGGAPCQCQYKKRIVVDDDGPHHGHTRTVFVMKSCPDDIAVRLAKDYWGSSMNPDDYNNNPRNDPSVEWPRNDFNSSPFAEPLARGLSWLFGKHEEGQIQQYLDQLRNWAPIDPRMAKDVEKFRNAHTDAEGEMSRGDKETYEFMKELLKLSQDMESETNIPARERPTPIPDNLSGEKIRNEYRNLYKNAQENKPLELNKKINSILKRLSLMSPDERAFHRTELARTFLNDDMTFKSLPYVENPGLKLESNSKTIAGINTRLRINGLMAAESEAMHKLHSYCDANPCENIGKSLNKTKRSVKQIYKNIELLDKVKGTLVDSDEFEREASDLVNDFNDRLGRVSTDQELNQLLSETKPRLDAVQNKRINVKRDLLDSWGGDSKLSEPAVNLLSNTSTKLIEYAQTLNDESTKDYYRDMAEGALDLALDFTPVVSTVKDLYEMISGTSLIGNTELSVADRAIRGVSIAVDVATLGLGGKISKVLLTKGSDQFISFLKSTADSSIPVNQINDIINAQKNLLSNADEIIVHNPILQSPLKDVRIGNVAVDSTFRSGTYLGYINKEPMKLFRVHSAPDNFGHVSSYWSRNKPSGPTQAMIDVALDASWGNKASKWIEIEIPSGMQIYEGIASPISRSGTNMSEFVGGGNQIFLPFEISEDWIKNRGKFF